MSNFIVLHCLDEERLTKRNSDAENLITLRTIVGVMEDNALLDALIKFAGAGGGSFAEPPPGMEKSSISLLSTIPVLGERICDPKYSFTVLVIETAFLSPSTIDK